MGHFNERPDLAKAIGDLDARLSKLESVNRVIPVQSGAPPANQQDGSISADKSGLFLYVVLNGIPRKTAVA